MKKLSGVTLAIAFAASVFAPANAFATGEEGEDYGEPTYTITYDFNGGATYDGKLTYEKKGLVSFAPDLSYNTLIDCFDYNSELDECHPLDIIRGKELNYVTVNDEVHDLHEGDGFFLQEDTTIKYFWTDLTLEDVNLSDDSGNEVTFEGIEGHEYHFEISRYSFNMTDEELEQAEVSREEFEMKKAIIAEALGDQGDLITYFEIGVYELAPECDLEEGCRNYIHEGPFDIKIKYTEDMGDFLQFKLVYLDITDEGIITVEDAINLELVDGYLVGTVPHLSGYAMVGSNNAPLAPNTGTVNNVTEAISKLPLFSAITLTTLAITIVVSKKAKR